MPGLIAALRAAWAENVNVRQFTLQQAAALDALENDNRILRMEREKGLPTDYRHLRADHEELKGAYYALHEMKKLVVAERDALRAVGREVAAKLREAGSGADVKRQIARLDAAVGKEGR